MILYLTTRNASAMGATDLLYFILCAYKGDYRYVYVLHCADVERTALAYVWKVKLDRGRITTPLNHEKFSTFYFIDGQRMFSNKVLSYVYAFYACINV
jgi:hypothetical protein